MDSRFHHGCVKAARKAEAGGKQFWRHTMEMFVVHPGI